MHEGSWDEARARVTSIFSSDLSNLMRGTEFVNLENSIGRYLAIDMVSLCDLPVFETSSMDGWAICDDGPWEIIGEVVTGTKSIQSLEAGQCIAISTGGVIPNGTTAVIPWEKVSNKDGYIIGDIDPGANIRPSGAECKKGDFLFSVGTLVNPPMAGLFAATGHDLIEVFKKPRVAIFFLGDELIHSGISSDGAIRDALGPQLPTIIKNMGALVMSTQFVKDDLTKLKNEITKVLDSVDIIISTGGTADGPRDYVKPVLEHFGATMIIDCVKVRPGYHMLLANINHGNRELPFLALPGNPQSALAALASFGTSLINAFFNSKPLLLKEIKITSEINTPEGFSRLVPGNLDGNLFTPTKYLGSAMLRGVANAQGFALINPGINSAGANARWIPFN